MKKIDFKTCSIEELWRCVASELARNDVDVILVGGAVASIYSNGEYISGDLDFVLNDLSRTKLNEVLLKLGFVQHSRHYHHPECKHLFLEFFYFPASIGEDNSIAPDEIEENGVLIKIYSPTDSVRDRLASYIHFKAYNCMDQAVMIAKRHPINFEKVKAWCMSEGRPEAFDVLMQKLKT